MLVLQNNDEAELTTFMLEYAIRNDDDIEFYGQAILKNEEIEIEIICSHEIAKQFLQSDTDGKVFCEALFEEGSENFRSLEGEKIGGLERFIEDARFSENDCILLFSVNNIFGGDSLYLELDRVKFSLNNFTLNVQDGSNSFKVKYDLSNERFYLDEKDSLSNCTFVFQVKSFIVN